MSMLDPSMPDGVHNWRDGKRILKEGDKLYIEGTDTLAGSYVASFIYVASLTVGFSSQGGNPRQMRPPVLLIHFNAAVSSDQMRNVQSCQVSRDRKQKGNA